MFHSGFRKLVEKKTKTYLQLGDSFLNFVFFRVQEFLWDFLLLHTIYMSFDLPEPGESPVGTGAVHMEVPESFASSPFCWSRRQVLLSVVESCYCLCCLSCISFSYSSCTLFSFSSSYFAAWLIVIPKYSLHALSCFSFPFCLSSLLLSHSSSFFLSFSWFNLLTSLQL